MAVLETMASSLNWILDFIAHIACGLLNVNYHFMTILIGFISESLNSICCTLQAALNLFHCYLIDFCSFVEEFAAVLYLIIAYVVHVLQSIYAFAVSLICSVLNVFQLLLSTVHITGASIYCVASHIAAALAYFSKLVFQAVILLLMLLPNAFLFLGNTLVRGALCVLHNFLVFWYHLKTSMAGTALVVKTGCINVFHSIPPKAYVGLLILIFIYYKRKPITRYSAKWFSVLSLLLIVMVKLVGLWLRTGFSHTLSATAKPFLWVLQLMPGRNSVAGRENLCQRGLLCVNVICSKLNLIGVLCRALGSMFRVSKSTDVNFKDPDQVMHLRYLEQKLNEERDRHLCIICQDELRTILLLPCRHLCLCSECWQSLENLRTLCPVCRRNVEHAFPVYV